MERLSSGTSAVDELLGELRAGDNVIWRSPARAALGPFVERFVAAAGRRPLVYVATAGLPAVPVDDAPRARVLDWRQEPASAEDARASLQAADEQAGEGALWVFDDLTTLQSRWGARAALDLFLWACPRLYERRTVAWWLLDRTAHTAAFLARLEAITQVVLDLDVLDLDDADRDAGAGGTVELRVVKADGRPEGHVGAVVRLPAGEVSATVTPGVQARVRLGLAVRAQREARGLAQAALARRVGITPSALSQFERGVRGLSAEHLTRLWEELGVPFGPPPDSARGYTISRRSAQHSLSPAHGVAADVVTELHDGAVAHLVTITAGAHGDGALFPVKGAETVIVLGGVVDLRVDGELETLHQGDAAQLGGAAVTGWANPGPDAARLLWIVASPGS